MYWHPLFYFNNSYQKNNMTASRSRKKSREHKKPEQRQEPAETEKPIEKQVRRLGMEVEILAVAVAVAIIAIVYMLSTGGVQTASQQPDELETINDKSCISVNPGLTQQECDDYALRDRAVYENLPELCDEIKTDGIKENCKKYF